MSIQTTKSSIYGDFYHTTIEPILDTTQGPLSKDCLELIDMSVKLNVTVNSFGPFIKFVIDNEIVPTRTENTAGRPAYDILMSAQQSLRLPFNDVDSSQTSEEHRPSTRKRLQKQRTLTFHGKLQYCMSNITVECEECGMWRLVYAKQKSVKMTAKNTYICS